MALSAKLKKLIQDAIPDPAKSLELITALQASVASPAADVAANSAASAVTVSADTIALSTADTYADADVNNAVNAALASVASKENVAIAALIVDINSTRTQINAILTALKNAGLMA